MSNKPVMLSIKDLFDNGKYLIPLYQRNYDWGHEHLYQLLQDVWDMARNAHPHRKYYLGTMVTHYNSARNSYEILDGQQRMLTLAIILCALKNESPAAAKICGWFKGLNITLELREKSTKALKEIYAKDEEQPKRQEIQHTSENDEAWAIRNMYLDVIPTLKQIFSSSTSADKKESDSFSRFSDYFLNMVIITRVLLPDDTDLNHYFEIANTRGEQLERHEILKVRILKPFEKEEDQKALRLAGRIWDACSDMNRYALFGLPAELRPRLLSMVGHGSSASANFDALMADAAMDDGKKESETSQQSILDIVAKGKPDEVSDKSRDNEQISRFSSVINFPNFLLQALRVLRKTDIPLDDKRLLETFAKENIDKNFSKWFLWELLRLRCLFDTFVIRRDHIDGREGRKWNLLKVAPDDKGHHYKNTFGDSPLQKEIIMREAMFHVSVPGQNYKHWLSGVLLHLSEHPDGQRLNEYLRELGKAYMRDHFLQPPEKQREYYDIIFMNKGIPSSEAPEDMVLPRYDKQHIDLFYFNFLDMQIWLERNRPAFTFTSRNSVEHFYPQRPIGGLKRLRKDYLHSFGNLCLISREKNSKLSNLPPQSKYAIYTEQLNKQREPDSLKQKEMMGVFGLKKTWGEVEIRVHAEEMKQLLIRSLADASPSETESSEE